MTVALDLGTFEARSLRIDQLRVVGRRSRMGFLPLTDSETNRDLLQRLGIEFMHCEDALILVGDPAAHVSNLLRVPCQDLFLEGRLPRNHPLARQLVNAVIRGLLPDPGSERPLCCVCLPAGQELWETSAPPLDSNQTAVRLDESLPANTDVRPTNRERTHPAEPDDAQRMAQIIRLQGYEPLFLPPGLAIILAELVESAFTGIGVDFGASATSLSIANRGREITRCSVPLGVDWVDERLAHAFDQFTWSIHGEQRSDLEPLHRWKRSLKRSLLAPANAEERRLSNLLSDHIALVFRQAAGQLAARTRLDLVPQPLPLRCAGGITLLPGFDRLVHETLRHLRFPLQIRDVRSCGSEWTIARGGLIYAELERRSQLQPAA